MFVELITYLLAHTSTTHADEVTIEDATDDTNEYDNCHKL